MGQTSQLHSAAAVHFSGTVSPQLCPVNGTGARDRRAVDGTGIGAVDGTGTCPVDGTESGQFFSEQVSHAMPWNRYLMDVDVWKV